MCRLLSNSVLGFHLTIGWPKLRATFHFCKGDITDILLYRVQIFIIIIIIIISISIIIIIIIIR